MSPAEAVCDFLCGLPDTIRNDILVFILLFSVDLPPGNRRALASSTLEAE
jgi:hypothetical protein